MSRLTGAVASAVSAAFGIAIVAGCAAPPSESRPTTEATAEVGARAVADPVEVGAPGLASPRGYGLEVQRDVDRIRLATAGFRDLGKAVTAGYPRDVSVCVDNPPAGAMGYHHIHPGLMDDVIEVERPEILVYERGQDGAYELVGVEYAVPFDAWTGAEPPVALGQELKPATGLQLWYLHVWVWRPNPSGLFADWNPEVECRRG